MAVGRHLFNALLLSFCFFGLFLAFQTTQNLESSIVPDERLGYWSLACIYIAFCFGALFISAPLANYLRPKLSLIVGGFCYLPLVASNLYPRWWTMPPAAALLGLGAGVLWAAQGTYITLCSSNYAVGNNTEPKSQMGFFNGIFFTIFQSASVIGSIIASIILTYSDQNNEQRSVHILFYTFLAVGSCGLFGFIFLGSESAAQQDEEAMCDAEPLVEHQLSTTQRLSSALRLLIDKKMIFLTVSLIYSGMEQSFVAGDFTASVVTKIKGKNWIGFVLSVFYLCDAVGSFTIGKISDYKYGKITLLTIGGLCHVVVFGFLLIYDQTHWISTEWLGDHFYIVFILSGILGIADACWNPWGPIMMSLMFTDNTDAAFSVLKFYQAFGSAMMFAWGPYLTLSEKLLILSGFLAVGLLCITILHVFVESIAKSRDEVLQNKPDRLNQTLNNNNQVN